jgi:ferrochelatase
MAEAVLLMGHGGPRSPEEVPPFVTKSAGGQVPEERIQAVVQQYMAIGGRSPFNELTQAQAAALQFALTARGKEMEVVIGTLHSKPSIAHALQQLLQRDIRNIVCVILAPHRTAASFEKYQSRLSEARDSFRAASQAAFSYLAPWHTQEKFIEAITDNVLRGLPQGIAKDSTRLIFTAHSVPEAMSVSSNYARQVEETAALVAGKLKTDNYAVSYQSRSGRPGVAWLEPDVVASIEQAAAQGMKQVVLVPVGFVSDNAEILYDLDILAKGAAHQRGLAFLRPSTVGCHPLFIEMLCDLVIAQTESFYVAERK